MQHFKFKNWRIGGLENSILIKQTGHMSPDLCITTPYQIFANVCNWCLNAEVSMKKIISISRMHFQLNCKQAMAIGQA